MSIRLNKAIRELNIGFQTAVEFLTKKYNLESGDLELTSKISDEQYDALIEVFKKDKETRNQVAQLFQKKPKEKKKVEVKDTRAEVLLESSKQQKFNPLGKIDLDHLNKKPEGKNQAKSEKTVEEIVESVAPEIVEPEKEKVAAVTPEPKVEDAPIESPKPAETKKEEKPAPVVEEKPVVKPEKEVKPQEAPIVDKPKKETIVEKAPAKKEKTSQEKKTVEAPKTVVVETPKVKEEKASAEEVKKVEAPVVEEKEEETQPEKPTLFQLNSEKKILENAPQLKIQGKLDLDSLNQSTRPKKKTKEEKRKEREEKNMLRGQQQEQRSEQKKKRDRINKVRVDINAASNQQTPNPESKKKDKKKKVRGRQKPLEVNEEDVARQVKETLARLTNKTNQNKKGAKYRKEKREAVQERLNEELSAERAESKVLKLTEFVTVSELATMMNIGVTQVIGTLMSVGIMVFINQCLDAETINLVADEVGFKTE